MTSKSVSLQEQGPVNSLNGCVNESWAQGEVSVIMSHNSPLLDKKAPTAEPEEDIDVLEPGAQDETLLQNQAFSRTDIADATKLETQESTRISLCPPRGAHEVVTELEQVARLSEVFKAQEESEEFIDPCEDASPLPPHLCALSTEEFFETEGFSSLEGEVAEWINDGEIISDPTENLVSPDFENIQERPETPPLTGLLDREVDSTPEELTGDNMKKEDENVSKLNFLPEYYKSEPENNISGAAAAEINSTHHPPSDGFNSDNIHALCSPPFADESEGDKEVSCDITSRQQQCFTQDIRSKPFQLSYLANISHSTEQTSTLPAVPLAKQQNELLSHSQCELAPKGANQEAAQQVLNQGCPPLSTVVMEPSNEGAAPFQGSGCVAALRERHSRVGERTEGEDRQTGGEEGQNEGGLERKKAVGQQHSGGLLTFSVQTQDFKTVKYKYFSSKDIRMESDSSDDSQSDSGVSADFSPGSTLEGNTTISAGTPESGLKETPIEREIRRAIEREQSLRRSRGLPNPPTLPEYVEIPLRKAVLCQSVTAKSERSQSKDKLFAGKKMQHEIHEEIQREQDLVKLGKVLGFYDKGTVRHLKEKKQLFEAFQKPSDSTLTETTRSKTMSWSSSSDISTLENLGETSSHAFTKGGSYVEGSPTQSPNSMKRGGSTSLRPQRPGFPEGTGCQVIILENNLSFPAQKLRSEAEPVTAVDFGSPNISSKTGGYGGIKGREQEQQEKEEEVSPRENPFFKLRSSTTLDKVEQDIREAQERERELHKQRISLYGGKEGAKGGGVGEGRGGRPAGIEEKSPTFSSSMNRSGSSSRGVSGPPAGKCSTV